MESPQPFAPPPAWTLTRALCLLILLLMLIGIVYAGWIVLVNWSSITV